MSCELKLQLKCLSKLARHFLVALSFVVFSFGYFDNSFNIMLVSVAMMWGCSVMYCFENWNSRMLLLMFNVVVFVFLMGRPLIDLFCGSKWHFSGYNANFFAVTSIYLSLISLMFGQWLGECKNYGNSRKSRIVREHYDNPGVFQKSEYIRNLGIVSLLLFYVSVVFLFAVELEKLLYMQGKSYEEIYVSFKTNLPYAVNALGSMCKYFLCIFLATMPSKRESLFPLTLFMISNVPCFLIGGRSKLVVCFIFVLVYFMIRDILDDGEKWFGTTEKFLILVGSPVALAFLGAYNYMREGKKIAPSGFFDLIIDFFYKQGVSFEVLKIGYNTIPKIKYTGFVNYTFGEVVDYLLHGTLAQVLWGAESLGSGQTQKLGLYSSLLANRMAYTASKAQFLKGHGWGSSYLLDTYADWGYVGIVVFSLLLGWLFSRMIFYFKKGVFPATMVLLVLTSIYYCPRSSATFWMSFVVYAQCWVSVALCFLCAGICTKKYSIRRLYFR